MESKTTCLLAACFLNASTMLYVVCLFIIYSFLCINTKQWWCSSASGAYKKNITKQFCSKYNASHLVKVLTIYLLLYCSIQLVILEHCFKTYRNNFLLINNVETLCSFCKRANAFIMIIDHFVCDIACEKILTMLKYGSYNSVSIFVRTLKLNSVYVLIDFFWKKLKYWCKAYEELVICCCILFAYWQQVNKCWKIYHCFC